jgi:hypothetical protein
VSSIELGSYVLTVVATDETHPVCKRCEKAEIPCGGYHRPRVWIDETPRLKRTISGTGRKLKRDKSSPTELSSLTPTSASSTFSYFNHASLSSVTEIIADSDSTEDIGGRDGVDSYNSTNLSSQAIGTLPISTSADFFNTVPTSTASELPVTELTFSHISFTPQDEDGNYTMNDVQDYSHIDLSTPSTEDPPGLTPTSDLTFYDSPSDLSVNAWSDTEELEQRTSNMELEKRSRIIPFNDLSYRIPDFLAMHAFEDNVYESFTVSKLFFGTPEPYTYGHPTSWLSAVSNMPNQSTMVKQSLQSLSAAFFGKMHGQRDIVQKGAMLYGKALAGLNKTLRDTNEAWSLDALVATVSLGIYEMVCSTTPLAWLHHAGGMARLIDLRGPKRHKCGLERVMFLTNRPVIVSLSFRLFPVIRC